MPAAAVCDLFIGYLAIYTLLLMVLLVFAARLIKRGPDLSARVLIPG